jgi:hypothetical protein
MNSVPSSCEFNEFCPSSCVFNEFCLQVSVNSMNSVFKVVCIQWTLSLRLYEFNEFLPQLPLNSIQSVLKFAGIQWIPSPVRVNSMNSVCDHVDWIFLSSCCKCRWHFDRLLLWISSDFDWSWLIHIQRFISPRSNCWRSCSTKLRDISSSLHDFLKRKPRLSATLKKCSYRKPQLDRNWWSHHSSNCAPKVVQGTVWIEISLRPDPSRKASPYHPSFTFADPRISPNHQWWGEEWPHGQWWWGVVGSGGSSEGGRGEANRGGKITSGRTERGKGERDGRGRERGKERRRWNNWQ